MARDSKTPITVNGVAVPTISSTDTLTNKTLTSPKINENVAMTATATELNVLDGIPATLTPTELGYVDGVTSAIQTQINAKGAGTVTGTGTTSELSYWTSATAQGTLPLSTWPSLTELSYVKNVTSAIQTQLNAKGVGTWTDSSTSTGSNKTFVAPALGTPASGVMTNVTGTAANLTAGSSSKITFQKQLNTTNSSVTGANIQAGVGGIVNNTAVTVTFPVAFSAIPIVLITGISGNGTGNTFAYPAASNGTNYNERVFCAHSQSTTGFVALMTGAATSASQISEFTWIAIGV